MDNIFDSASQDKSMLFTEDVPKYGRVSMLFYIPETVQDRDTFVELIKQNGGNIVKFHECFTYQLGPPENTQEHDYFTGPVYSFQWITDSVEQNSLQDKANYIMLNIASGADFPFQNKKKIPYTIREIMIIFKWISGRKSQSSRKTWENLGKEGILYCRSKESLKNFWKKWSNTTLEDCITQMLQKDTRYCHNYSETIQPHQEIPEDRAKNKQKRVRPDGETSEFNIGDDDDSNAMGGKQFKKRMLKKMDTEAKSKSDGNPNK
jgi:hypothetical protein